MVNDAYAVREKDNMAKARGRHWFRFSSTALAVLFASPGFGIAAVNVYLATGTSTTLQRDLIAGLTTQWNGNLVASPFQPGTYSFTVSSKKNVIPPTDCPVCLVDVSSEPFTYGYVFGQGDQAKTDLGIVNKYLVGCSTDVSCEVGLSSAAVDMYSLVNGTPTVVLPTGQ